MEVYELVSAGCTQMTDESYLKLLPYVQCEFECIREIVGQFEQKVLAGCSSWKNPASAFKQMQNSELD